MANGQVNQPPVPLTVYVSFMAGITDRTAEQLIAFISDLSNRGVQTVHLLLSTPGGSIATGMHLHNVLKGMPIKIITHNVGNVDSIGNVIFLAGDERYACDNATFMFHGAGFGLQNPVQLEEKELTEKLQAIQADNQRIVDVVSTHTSINTKELHDWTKLGKTISAQDALGFGICNELRAVSIPAGTQVFQIAFK